MRDTFEVVCPYCGEVNEIFLDYSGGLTQAYIEDCQVCCRPWEVRIDLSEEEPIVTVVPSDD
ncbi:MAG: CPXCG motif-containing cysteine-rich protein [bacterium]